MELRSKDVLSSGPFPPRTITPSCLTTHPAGTITFILIGFHFNCTGGRRGSFFPLFPYALKVRLDKMSLIQSCVCENLLSETIKAKIIVALFSSILSLLIL